LPRSHGCVAATPHADKSLIAPAFASRPGRGLAVSAALVAVLAIALPFLPRVDLLGFVPLPPALLAALLGITAAYVAASEGVKRVLLARSHAARAPLGTY
jgi:hypothetical protein